MINHSIPCGHFCYVKFSIRTFYLHLSNHIDRLMIHTIDQSHNVHKLYAYVVPCCIGFGNILFRMCQLTEIIKYIIQTNIFLNANLSNLKTGSFHKETYIWNWWTVTSRCRNHVWVVLTSTFFKFARTWLHQSWFWNKAPL